MCSAPAPNNKANAAAARRVRTCSCAARRRPGSRRSPGSELGGRRPRAPLPRGLAAPATAARPRPGRPAPAREATSASAQAGPRPTPQRAQEQHRARTHAGPRRAPPEGNAVDGVGDAAAGLVADVEPPPLGADGTAAARAVARALRTGTPESESVRVPLAISAPVPSEARAHLLLVTFDRVAAARPERLVEVPARPHHQLASARLATGTRARAGMCPPCASTRTAHKAHAAGAPCACRPSPEQSPGSARRRPRCALGDTAALRQPPNLSTCQLHASSHQSASGVLRTLVSSCSSRWSMKAPWSTRPRHPPAQPGAARQHCHTSPSSAGDVPGAARARF